MLWKLYRGGWAQNIYYSNLSSKQRTLYTKTFKLLILLYSVALFEQTGDLNIVKMQKILTKVHPKLHHWYIYHFAVEGQNLAINHWHI